VEELCDFEAPKQVVPLVEAFDNIGHWVFCAGEV
jgi:hypothetical protein